MSHLDIRIDPHVLKLSHLIVLVEVKSHSKVLKVGFLSLFKTVFEQFKVVKEFKMQIVQLGDTLMIYLRY